MKKISDNFYLITPILCIFMWYILYLIHHYITNGNLIMNNSDFLAGYNAGKQIFIDPSKLYTRDDNHEDLFFNMPSFAVFLSITFSLIPNKSIANHCFHIFILFLAILSVIEYNKILFLNP